MIEKIKMMPLMAYLTVTNFFEDLKKDEDGMSDAVVAILLVLVGVLAAGLIWGWMSGWLEEMWGRITAADTIGR